MVYQRWNKINQDAGLFTEYIIPIFVQFSELTHLALCFPDIIFKIFISIFGAMFILAQIM